MKKLSEFENEQGVIVVAKLLQPIARIVAKAANLDRNKSAIEFVSSMLAESPKDTMEIFAILSETPVEEYRCNAASILADSVKLASDKELMELFGFQSQTPTSSGSATETSEDKA